MSIKVTVVHFDEKPLFLVKLGHQKKEKMDFGQFWIYQIWPNMFWDSHSTHQQYPISLFLGEFNKLKKCFQPGVSSLDNPLSVEATPLEAAEKPLNEEEKAERLTKLQELGKVKDTLREDKEKLDAKVKL